MDTHFANIKLYCQTRKINDRNLTTRIIKAQHTYGQVLDSVHSVCELLRSKPWVDEQVLYEMLCILPTNKGLYNSIMEKTNFRKTMIVEDKYLFLEIAEIATVLPVANARLEFALNLLSNLQHDPGIRVCYFGMYRAHVFSNKYNVRLMWATCGTHGEMTSSMCDNNHFMIMGHVSKVDGYDEDENNVQVWVNNIVATIINDDREQKRYAIYDKNEHNFADDFLAYQNHILPFVFNRAHNELNPFTTDMKQIVQHALNSTIKTSEFLTKVYIQMSNAYLHKTTAQYLHMMSKIVQTNGYSV